MNGGPINNPDNKELEAGRENREKRLLKRSISASVIFHLLIIIITMLSTKHDSRNEDLLSKAMDVDLAAVAPPPPPVRPEPKVKMPAPEKIKSVAAPAPAPRAVVPMKAPVASNTPRPAAPAPMPSAGTEAPKEAAPKPKSVSQMGLLSSLGAKASNAIKPNDALASVNNMEGVNRSRGNAPGVKVSGIAGNLGETRSIGGGVINNGAGDYKHSTGIGGKGTVGAMDSENTGKRKVKAVVAAPVAKKVTSSGGGISREDVAKVINEHMDEVVACYEKALVKDPNLKGRIEFEWTITLSGEVGEITIKSSTVRSASLTSAVRAVIKTWQFPKPVGDSVVVSYPFVFDLTSF